MIGNNLVNILSASVVIIIVIVLDLFRSCDIEIIIDIMTIKVPVKMYVKTIDGFRKLKDVLGFIIR